MTNPYRRMRRAWVVVALFAAVACSSEKKHDISQDTANIVSEPT